MIQNKSSRTVKIKLSVNLWILYVTQGICQARQKKKKKWENECRPYCDLQIAYNNNISCTVSAIPKALTAPYPLIRVTFPCFCPAFVLAIGLQAILPEYLRARFVQAALSYIGCNEEGQFVCRDNDCWCECKADYPQCNCPEVDLKAMEASVLKILDSWNMANQDFEESGQCSPFCTHTLALML